MRVWSQRTVSLSSFCVESYTISVHCILDSTILWKVGSLRRRARARQWPNRLIVNRNTQTNNEHQTFQTHTYFRLDRVASGRRFVRDSTILCVGVCVQNRNDRVEPQRQYYRDKEGEWPSS